MAPVPFLVKQLGPSARIAVEVAWGADLTAASTTWTWTDITSDVRIAGGIHLKHGRSDEASATQPASCALTLDNSTGAYSLGGQSPNWPFVRQNTPVRVRVDPADGPGYRTLFIGYADSWQPAWNQAATVADVKLSASGVLRRLQQRTSPVLSSLRRRLTTESNVVAYWPLEDGRKSTSALSALPEQSPMDVRGVVDFASDTTTFDSSVQSPVLKNGSLVSGVPAYAHTGEWQVRVLMGFPDQLLADLTVLLRIYTDSSSVNRIDLVYGTFMNGSGQIKAYNSAGTEVVSTGFLDMDMLDVGTRVYVDAEQSGSNVSFTFGSQDVRNPVGFGSVPVVLSSATLGRVTRVEVFPNADTEGVSVGHVVVQNERTSVTIDRPELMAFDGEAAITRFRRLCDENGIERIEVGDGLSESTVTHTMGAQRPDTLLSLLRDTETVDRGIIYDGVGNAGLTRWGRRAMENRSATLTIDASAAELAGVLAPVDDDQARVNKALVTREDGSTAVAEDVDGPVGTATVGIYDTSASVPCKSDDAPPLYAGWLVHLGTVEGYRYPAIELDLVAAPNLIPAWLTIGPGRRMDLTNVTDVVPQHPDEDVRLLVQGYEQTLTPYTWTVSVNCSPYDPWRIGRLATDTGDTSVTVLRLDAESSTLAAPAAAGATSLSVASAGSTLWTTNPDDLPLEIDVGGVVVDVTGISGASSPQTFTVTGSTVTKALASGLAVTVHHPKFLGL